MLWQVVQFHSFLWLRSIPLYIYIYVYTHTHTHTHPFIYSSIEGHLGWFHFLATVNKAAGNISFHITGVFFNTRRSQSAGSYGSSTSSFLGNLHTLCHSSCTSLHSHQQGMRVPFFPHTHQHLLSVFVLIIDILTSAWWHLIEFPWGLAKQSIFSCACGPSSFPLWKNVQFFQFLYQIGFLVCLFFWWWVVWAIWICWMLIPYHIICKYFLPFSKLSSHFVGFLCYAKAFKFD